MSFNKENLDHVLAEMKNVFINDRNAAIRGQVFIKMLHNFCISELEKRGFSGKNGELRPEGEVKVLTSHKFKDIDVAVIHPTSGPLLVIGVRSQMSSLSKNFLNYYEMEVGDVSAIHERYPMCVVGLLYLHPSASIVSGKETEGFNFGRAEKMFRLITGRTKTNDPISHYEEIAYLRVNFDQMPPTIDNDFPTITELKLDSFFDKLVDKYMERNFPLIKE